LHACLATLPQATRYDCSSSSKPKTGRGQAACAKAALIGPGLGIQHWSVNEACGQQAELVDWLRRETITCHPVRLISNGGPTAAPTLLLLLLVVVLVVVMMIMTMISAH